MYEGMYIIDIYYMCVLCVVCVLCVFVCCVCLCVCVCVCVCVYVSETERETCLPTGGARRWCPPTHSHAFSRIFAVDGNHILTHTHAHRRRGGPGSSTHRNFIASFELTPRRHPAATPPTPPSRVYSSRTQVPISEFCFMTRRAIKTSV
jgi:hypothetical protein